MNATSTNLGITTPCPECKKILLASADMVGHATFKYNMKCTYCGKRIKIEVGQKTFITATLIATLAVAFCMTAWDLIISLSTNAKFAYLIQTYGFQTPK